MAFFPKSAKRGSNILFLVSVIILIAVVILSFILFPFVGHTVSEKTSLPQTINSHTK